MAGLLKSFSYLARPLKVQFNHVRLYLFGRTIIVSTYFFPGTTYIVFCNWLLLFGAFVNV